jgi:hypothetical protein
MAVVAVAAGFANEIVTGSRNDRKGWIGLQVRSNWGNRVEIVIGATLRWAVVREIGRSRTGSTGNPDTRGRFSLCPREQEPLTAPAPE